MKRCFILACAIMVYVSYLINMHYITIFDVLMLFWKLVTSGTILLKLFCQRKKLNCLLLYYYPGPLGLCQQAQNVSLVKVIMTYMKMNRMAS